MDNDKPVYASVQDSFFLVHQHHGVLRLNPIRTHAPFSNLLSVPGPRSYTNAVCWVSYDVRRTGGPAMQSTMNDGGRAASRRYHWQRSAGNRCGRMRLSHSAGIGGIAIHALVKQFVIKQFSRRKVCNALHLPVSQAAAQAKKSSTKRSNHPSITNWYSQIGHSGKWKNFQALNNLLFRLPAREHRRSIRSENSISKLGILVEFCAVGCSLFSYVLG